jgi:hypothetical protein
MEKVRIFTWQPELVESRTKQTEKKLTMYRVKSLRYMVQFMAENSQEKRLNIRYKAQAYWAIKQQMQVHYYGGLPENEIVILAEKRGLQLCSLYRQS